VKEGDSAAAAGREKKTEVNNLYQCHSHPDRQGNKRTTYSQIISVALMCLSTCAMVMICLLSMASIFHGPSHNVYCIVSMNKTWEMV